MPSKIALIISSTRNPRVGPAIANLLRNHLSHTHPNHPIDLLDLASHPLPLFDEPLPPSLITSPTSYAHSHTQNWSRTISAYSAFIFLTPQYNWSIPSALKNAIDYLFHEWKGKPAMVVSYGGHGGGKAASALVEVCKGCRMRVVERTVGLTLGDVERAARKGELVGDEEEKWGEELKGVEGCLEELVGMLEG